MQYIHLQKALFTNPNVFPAWSEGVSTENEEPSHEQWDLPAVLWSSYIAELFSSNPGISSREGQKFQLMMGRSLSDVFIFHPLWVSTVDYCSFRLKSILLYSLWLCHQKLLCWSCLLRNISSLLKKKKRETLKMLFSQFLENYRCLANVAAMTNEFFPLCDCIHFFWIYSCLTCCVPVVWRTRRYIRLLSRSTLLWVSSVSASDSFRYKLRLGSCKSIGSHCSIEWEKVLENRPKAPSLWTTVVFDISSEFTDKTNRALKSLRL